jgi:hypothetical protein
MQQLTAIEIYKLEPHKECHNQKRAVDLGTYDWIRTSTIETRTADIIANEWPAENVGGPHCKGYGNLNLKLHKNLNQQRNTVQSKWSWSWFLIIPWGSRYKIRSVSTATDLSSKRLVFISPTSSQDKGIDPNDWNTEQYWESFKNRDISKWPHILQILQFTKSYFTFNEGNY